jgi:hypothetical protein
MKIIERGPIPQEKGKPYEIISHTNSLRITFPEIGTGISLVALPGGHYKAKGEILRSFKEECLLAEVQFTETTRKLIAKRLEDKAAMQFPGSEEIGPETSVASLKVEFKQNIEDLRKKGYSEERIMKMLKDQGKQFTAGETHMGQMPPVVKEEVTNLNTVIYNIFNGIDGSGQKRVLWQHSL